jgi:hypothetical protein
VALRRSEESVTSCVGPGCLVLATHCTQGSGPLSAPRRHRATAVQKMARANGLSNSLSAWPFKRPVLRRGRACSGLQAGQGHSRMMRSVTPSRTLVPGTNLDAVDLARRVRYKPQVASIDTCRHLFTQAGCRGGRLGRSRDTPRPRLHALERSLLLKKFSE